jgi:FMN-dependent oxidoreductase (nitrilotriacetate monooxygenase family)
MNEAPKQMKLIGVWTPPGSHIAGWRMPGSPTHNTYSLEHLVQVARLTEQAKMDALFFADSNAMQTAPSVERGDRAAEEYSKIVRLEAASMLAALAPVTSRLGLIATATTTYNEPYNVARRFATIDQLSAGRAGWNLVTSQHELEAQNYGYDEHMEHDERYLRAEEFFDVCAGLWDCWDEGAIVQDKQTARYADISKLHVLNHKGKYFRVKGPLNVPRSPQGRPIIAQAGASGPGKDLAARIADLIFLASSTIEDCKAFSDDVRARAIMAGRAPSDLKTMPGIVPIVGRTESEAKEHYEQLESLVTDEQGLASLRRLAGGLDLTKLPLDGPMPDLPPTNGPQTRQNIVMEWARKENLTLRQVGRRFGGSVGHNFVWGTPQHIADVMEDWVHKEACDGFCVIYPYFPRGVEDFTSLVVPELQRRGLFRTEYEGRTLRENLGIPLPKSRFAQS